MRRWRDELPIMLRRWRLELRQHGYDWGDYAGPYLAGATICVRSCHCEKGPGHYRKRRPLQHHHSCDLCHYGKDIGMFGGHGRFAGKGYRFRQNREYRFLKEDLAAHEPIPYRSRKRKVLPHRVSIALEDAMQPYTHTWERLPNGNMRMVRNPKSYVWPREFVEMIRQDEIRRRKRQPLTRVAQRRADPSDDRRMWDPDLPNRS